MSSAVRIGVISDSHGDHVSLEVALSALGEVDYLIHAGDYWRDSQRLARLLSIPVIGVAGNCDSHYHPQEEIVELSGQRLFITHGHRYCVKSETATLVQAARRFKADVAIFGHTHVPALFVQHSILFLNPGSTALGRQGAPRSCALLTINGIEVNAAFISL